MEFKNKVEIAGIVGRVNTQTVGEEKIINLSVATNYAYKDRQGNAVIDTTWFNCCLWSPKDKEAVLLDKGDAVSLTGRLRTRNYYSENNEPRTVTEVVVKDITVLPKEN